MSAVDKDQIEDAEIISEEDVELSPEEVEARGKIYDEAAKEAILGRDEVWAALLVMHESNGRLIVQTTSIAERIVYNADRIKENLPKEEADQLFSTAAYIAQEGRRAADILKTLGSRIRGKGGNVSEDQLDEVLELTGAYGDLANSLEYLYRKTIQIIDQHRELLTYEGDNEKDAEESEDSVEEEDVSQDSEQSDKGGIDG